LPQRPTSTAPPRRADPDFTGLGKIAAHWASRSAGNCTYHGVALNVAMDLEPFSAYQPLRLCRTAKRWTFLQSASQVQLAGRPLMLLGRKLATYLAP